MEFPKCAAELMDIELDFRPVGQREMESDVVPAAKALQGGAWGEASRSHPDVFDHKGLL
jgi:hypothetical protein